MQAATQPQDSILARTLRIRERMNIPTPILSSQAQPSQQELQLDWSKTDMPAHDGKHNCTSVPRV